MRAPRLGPQRAQRGQQPAAAAAARRRRGHLKVCVLRQEGEEGSRRFSSHSHVLCGAEPAWSQPQAGNQAPPHHALNRRTSTPPAPPRAQKASNFATARFTESSPPKGAALGGIEEQGGCMGGREGWWGGVRGGEMAGKACVWGCMVLSSGERV